MFPAGDILAGAALTLGYDFAHCPQDLLQSSGATDVRFSLRMWDALRCKEKRIKHEVGRSVGAWKPGNWSKRVFCIRSKGYCFVSKFGQNLKKKWNLIPICFFVWIWFLNVLLLDVDIYFLNVLIPLLWPWILKWF